MAYAALLSLAQTIGEIILNPHRYSISHDIKQEIRSIYEPIIFLQGFLDDFPEKANSMERRIRDVADEAEDMIQYFMWKQSHPFIRLIEWTLLPAKFKSKHQLRKIREEIDSIRRKAMVLTINSAAIKADTMEEGLGDSPPASSSSRYAATSKINDMVGLHDDLIAIKSRLCGESSKLQVIPIVGMGGIGKTTLARNAYNDSLAMQYFHVRAWVTISQDYNAQQILSGLLSFMKLPNEVINDEQINRQSRTESSMAEEVYKGLKGRRYLVVMDDMWSTKAWEDVRNIFPDDGNGSRIMLTTRLSDVATYPDPCSPLHEMHLMNNDQSWNLLRQKVFTHQDCPPELENIGQEIARNCRGLPLAIVVIAGLLSTVSKDPTSWRGVAKNVNSVVTAEHGQFEKILALSYTQLPHYLRPCFLYMGIFPADHEVCVSKLIRLWVAEGFLKYQKCKSLEEVAEECLEDLVKRNLVLVIKRKSSGKIKSCNLHDLVWDLCRRKVYEEKFLVNIWNSYSKKSLSIRSREKHRRISITPFGLPHLPKTYCSTIHTIMWFHHIFALDSLKSFKLLKILDAGDAHVESLPTQLFELFHLRYLAINYPKKIPSSISKLQNLQTLIIQTTDLWKLYAMRRDGLPQEIWRMPQLRHLLFHGTLPHPEGTTTLENLQSLHISLSRHMCTKGFMKMIPNLKKLKINCYNSQGGTHLNNLVYLHQLENLELHSYVAWRKDNFTFPMMLKKLTLSGLSLPWEEMTVVGSLPNLRVLKLRDNPYKGSTWETTEGEFPKLEVLLLEELYLEHWITESSHFPRLKFMMIHDCWRLSEIPDGLGELPTLELIEVKGHVKKSLVESAKRIQEEQQNLGNDDLQVRCMRRKDLPARRR